MKKIVIEDLLQFQYPSNLQYNPSGTVLAFVVTKTDVKKNTYWKQVWILENGKAKVLTETFDTSLVTWKDDQTLIVTRKVEEELDTTLYELSIKGGEAKPFLKVPFPVTSLQY